uniref:DUF4216 domain-containing protein n=1 Tax=Oryza brachyantha TaxID=4533 RepID=J3MWG3_ORYBR
MEKPFLIVMKIQINAGIANNESAYNTIPNAHQNMGNSTVTNEETGNFQKLINDAEQELYHGCDTFSILSFIVQMLNIKCLYDLSGNAMNALFEVNMLKLNHALFVEFQDGKIMDRIELNVCDSIVGTLLNWEGKTKDNIKSRFDLEVMKIRPQLRAPPTGDGKYLFRPACYAMTLAEKKAFCEFLREIKVPHGYSSKISHYADATNAKISGMKCHDCHMFLDRYLLLSIRGVLPANVCETIIELCNFFREICSQKLDIEIVKELTTIIELCNKILKLLLLSIFATVGRPLLGNKYCQMAMDELEKARIYVLKNCQEISEYAIIHKDELSIQSNKGVEKRHEKEFFAWFKNHILELYSKESPTITEELFALARGPDARVNHFTSYMINGWRFNTEDRDMLIQSQNSGVFVKGDEVSGAEQVYYVKDTRDPNWFVVVKTKPCDLYDFPPEEEEENDPTLLNRYNSEACQESELITTASNSITDHDGDDHIILSKNGAECESIKAKIATCSEGDIFEDEEEEHSESDGAEYIDTDNETGIQSEEDDS